MGGATVNSGKIVVRGKTDAVILHGSTPDLYEAWLKRVIQPSVNRQPAQQFVFINAWNEWAEENHLEPCQKWGRAYIEATQRALSESISQAVSR